MAHIPVLLNETIEILKPEEGRAFIDATIDGGGHGREILKRMGQGTILVGIDRDKTMIESLQKEFHQEPRLKLITGNFRHLSSSAGHFAKSYDGILFDLGLSSLQLEKSGRGFSFLRDEPLLMTYESNPDPDKLTAAKIINSWPEKELLRIIKEYGEERYAPKIARAIVEARRNSRILTTGTLAQVIKKAVPAKYGRLKIHPATKTFQALRIAVNDELGALNDGLREAWNLLGSKGRLAVISFHSLEDRIVKNFFRSKKDEAELLTKKPIRPEAGEIGQNPRARSAKLRAAIKI